MKKQFLSLAVVSTLAMGLTGCGGGDSEGSSSANGVSFDTTGTYDIRDYIAPSSSDTITYNGYEEETYAVNGDNYTLSYYDYDEDGNYGLNEDEFTVTSTKISHQDASMEEIGGDGSMDVARHIDINDVFVNESFNMSKSDSHEEYGYSYSVNFNGTFKCTLTNHYDTKTFDIDGSNYTFNDVLQADCIMSGSGSNSYTMEGITQTVPMSEVDKSTSYFAKGIGEVVEYDRNCYDSDYNLQDDQTTCASEEENWRVATSYNEPVFEDTDDSSDSDNTSDSMTTAGGIENLESYSVIYSVSNVSDDIKQNAILQHDSNNNFKSSDVAIDCSNLNGYTLDQSASITYANGLEIKTYNSSDNTKYCYEYDYQNVENSSGSLSYTLAWDL
jgi:hypothetical protein